MRPRNDMCDFNGLVGHQLGEYSSWPGESEYSYCTVGLVF
jgi:hypothetical protein